MRTITMTALACVLAAALAVGATACGDRGERDRTGGATEGVGGGTGGAPPARPGPGPGAGGTTTTTR